jgi:PRTRC genetic system protein A
MNPVGYLTNTPQGLKGEPGIGYNYLLAANGLFLRASNPLLSATIQVAPADVRGLAPLTEELTLAHGRIPFRLMEPTLTFLTSWGCELYLGVVWKDGAYEKVIPVQTGSPASVQYERRPHTLLDVHTHGKMRAFFSGTDDRDERGFQLYMVVGRLDLPVKEVALRLGIYCYFAPLDWGEVFDRPPPPWLEVVTSRPNFSEGEPHVPPDLR